MRLPLAAARSLAGAGPADPASGSGRIEANDEGGHLVLDACLGRAPPS